MQLSMDAFHLVTQTSFYLSWYLISNKDRMILESTCVSKWKAFYKSHDIHKNVNSKRLFHQSWIKLIDD